MIEITDLAAEKLSTYLSENKFDSPIRIYLMSGCSGSLLRLALDEPKESDYIHEVESFTLLIDQDLSKSCGKVKLDYLESSAGGNGFSLTSERPLPAASGGCGGSCSSGSCGC